MNRKAKVAYFREVQKELNEDFKALTLRTYASVPIGTIGEVTIELKEERFA
jgi:hypothetical protein